MRQSESCPLFDRIASFENLYQAAAESRRGKRFKDATARFDRELVSNLLRLREERFISAAPNWASRFSDQLRYPR